MLSRRVTLVLAVLLAACAVSQAGLTQINSPSGLTVNGTVDWGDVGSLFSWHWPPETVNVAGMPGQTITATMSKPGARFIRQDSGNAWSKNFSAGAKLLWNGADETEVPCAVDLILNRPVQGIGLHASNGFFGTFTATMAVYDSKDVLLGTYSVNATASATASAPFLGVLSTESNIKRVRISTSDSSLQAGSADDFAIDGPVIVGLVEQRPIISALQNNYSYVLPNLPNYGIAQGSIFVMYGANMGPPTVTQQTRFPLQKTFSGVQINVTVGGTTTQAIPYYVSAFQSAAILASNTPAGDGTITVTYNGQTGPAAPIRVLPNAPGILTASGNTGLAQATDIQGRLVNYTNSANPQEIITFWGSGLGAVTADETDVGPPIPLPKVPLEIYIGGKAATVQYWGRSQYPGLDQINVYVPAGVVGCNVGVFAKINNIVSNSVTIPVAITGRTCFDDGTGYAGDRLQSLLSGGPFNVGVISLRRTMYYGGGAPVLIDSASATFGRFDPRVFSSYQAYLRLTAVGSCQVGTSRVDLHGDGILTKPVGLNAGSVLRVTTSTGAAIDLPGGTGGTYSNQAPAGAVLFPPNTAATVTISGLGGSDVGPFTASVIAPIPPTWTNMNNIGTVDRTQPLTLTWDGGPAGSLVYINGSSFVPDQISPLGATFSCLARVEDKKFTVPSYALLALPPSSADFPIPATLSLINTTAPAPFTATGLALGLIEGGIALAKPVTYK